MNNWLGWFGVWLLCLLWFGVSSAEEPSGQRFVGFAQEESVVRGENGYAGAQVCMDCHPAESTAWRATPHAGAYETLVREDAHLRAECVTCHTTGFGYSSGFEMNAEDRRLAGVQCETCHGPGLRHVRRPEARNIRSGTDQQVCRDCHNAEQTPDFEARFSEMIGKVNHRAAAGPVSTTVEEALAQTGGEPVRVELFVMTYCPYGIQAEQALLPALRAFGDAVDFHLYFIAEEAGAEPEGETEERRRAGGTRAACAGEPMEGTGRFRSLHGDAEVEEGVRQAVMMKFYPDRFFDYLARRNKDIYFSNWKRCASEAGMDPARIEAAATGAEGEALFRENIRRANQLGVNASPTLFVNGREVDVEADALRREICRSGAGGSLCASFPECEQDRDCERAGKVGVCVKPGTPEARCRFTDPALFRMTVLNDPECSLCETGHFIRSTRELFPGAQVEALDITEPAARELIARNGIDRVPAFVLSEGFGQTAHFKRFERTVRRVKDGYLPGPAMVPMARLLDRAAEPGRLDLFVDPSLPFALGLAGQMVTWMQAVQDSSRLRIHFVSGDDSGGDAVRYLCVQQQAPARLWEYLMCRIRGELGGDGEMTPQACAKAVGLNADELARCASGTEGRKLLEQSGQAAAAFGIGERMNPAVVVDNRDVVSGRLVQHIQELFYQMHPDLLSLDGKRMNARGK